MKKVVHIFIVLFAVFTKSTAQENFTINMGAGIVSKYVIRGVEYGKGSFQPDITFSYKGAFLMVGHIFLLTTTTLKNWI